MPCPPGPGCGRLNAARASGCAAGRPDAGDGIPRRTPVDATGTTTVLEVSGLNWATSGAIVEKVLSRRPGVLAVQANPVGQTATVTYDPALTSVAQLTGWVRDCGYHCSGRSVPRHVCDPLVEPPGVSPSAAPPAMVEAGGPDAGMSTAGMITGLRNRFVVAAVLAVPVLLWSPIGREVLGFHTPAPFGLRDDVFSLLLSLPVVFYSAWIFFAGAYRALRAGTLDMMVLVAVAVGAGWLYSLVVTLTGGGDVFYEAATVLTAFVLLGTWFEMRDRGGANDAIRSLRALAPPQAVVLRGGEPVEVPTAEVRIGDLLV